MQATKYTTYRNLHSAILGGRLELVNDLFGSNKQYATIRIFKTGKVETMEVNGPVNAAQAAFFNIPQTTK